MGSMIMNFTSARRTWSPVSDRAGGFFIKHILQGGVYLTYYTLRNTPAT